MKKTTEEFIQSAQSVHGIGKYDYSLVEYVSSKTKVKIICSTHGVFEQRPSSHLLKHGCAKCQRKTTEEFIQSAKITHATNKYDYSLVAYINDKAKVKIICPTHGVFEQKPSSHLRGASCPRCSRNKKKTTEEFILEAKLIHGINRFDYSLVEYVDARTKVKIVCPTHGAFEQESSSHLRGAGCPDCSATRIAKSRGMTIESFVLKATAIHGIGKYDYSLVECVSSKAKVKIICPTHGVFEQKPSSHLRGAGCSRCSRNKKKTTEEFILEAKSLHGTSNYDYSLTQYVNAKIKIKIICPAHGIFEQKPDDHVKGRGCPSCAKSGFDHSKQGILYLLRFQKDFALFWKIGITNRTVDDRFGSESLFIKERYEWEFEYGGQAYGVEQSILNQFAKFKHPPFLFPLLNCGGGTECFTLNLPHKKVIFAIESQIAMLDQKSA